MARRPRPPADVQRHVVGRPLAAEELDDGAWLVLTRVDAAVLDADGVRWRRPWHEIDHGEWEGESHTLSVTFGDGREPVGLRTLAEHPREMPLVFRERVDASVVHTVTVQADGGGKLRGDVRRTSDGELISRVTSVGPVRRGPALDAQVAELETRIRGEVGL